MAAAPRAAVLGHGGVRVSQRQRHDRSKTARTSNGWRPCRRRVSTCPNADLAEAPISYVPPADLTKKDTHGVFRLRQARYFPTAVILGTPTLYYGWEEDPDDELLNTLDEIAFGVTHVGTSHSIAILNVSAGKMPVSSNYTPNSKGNVFLGGDNGRPFERTR